MLLPIEQNDRDRRTSTQSRTEADCDTYLYFSRVLLVHECDCLRVIGEVRQPPFLPACPTCLPAPTVCTHRIFLQEEHEIIEEVPKVLSDALAMPTTAESKLFQARFVGASGSLATPGGSL